MAKGDSKRSQNAVDYQGGTSQNYLNELQGRNREQYSGIQNNPSNPLAGNYTPSPALNPILPGSDSYSFSSPPLLPSGGQQGQGQGQQILDPGQFESWFMPRVQGRPITAQTLQAMEPELNAIGAKLVPNADGTRFDIQLADGRWIDVVQNFGGPEAGRRWQVLDDGYGNGGSSSGSGGTFPGMPFGPMAPGIQQALGGFGEFAQTGGFSPQDIQNIRARATAPTRAIYRHAQDELERGKNLSGGYMPNFAPAQAKMARQASQQIGDISVNNEAGIAEAIRSGRLAGLSGLAGIGDNLGRLGLGYGNLGLGYGELGLGYGNLGLGYGDLGVRRELGLGDIALRTSGQGINLGDSQNRLGLGLIDSQIRKSQVPGNYDVAMGRIGSAAGVAGPIAGVF